MRFTTTAVIALTASLICAGTALAEVRGANEDPANTEKTDKTVTVALPSEPSTILGSVVSKAEDEIEIVSGCITDTLVTRDKGTGDVIPCLATEWEWVDDTHCRFTLRDDVTMTDGTPLVADDVAYSFNVFATSSPNTDTGRYIALNDDGSADCVVEDEHTVTIGFSTIAPDFLKMLTWANFGIFSEDEVEALGGLEEASNNPVLGSGKYIFDSWERGQSITLKRNENYWNPDYAGYYETIVFTFQNDPASRAMSVQSGDAQVAYNMPITQAANYAETDGVDAVIYEYGQNVRMWYNMTEGHVTEDQTVREAISKALNHYAIAAVGTANFGGPTFGYFGTDSPYYNATYSEEDITLDVEGAKALLEEAGYGDGLELTILGLQYQEPVYTVIQENLRAIGINLTLDIPDTAQFVESAFAGNYDLIALGDYVDARYPSIISMMQQSMLDAGTVFGGPKATTPEIDAAITDAIQEPDEAEAKEKMATVENLMKEVCACTELYPEMVGAVVSDNVKGYTTRERGYVDATMLYEG